MFDPNAPLPALAGLVFVLGLRHGLDADHLAAVDGMTRLQVQAGRRLASACGALFALGHGAALGAVVVALAQARQHAALPQWLAGAASLASLLLLAALGAANLRALRAAPPGVAMGLYGLRAPMFGRLMRGRGPGSALAVGALFALSFDTLALAALMAASGILQTALALAGLFIVGMLVADGLCGLWLARLLINAQAVAPAVSRALGLTVALGALGVAGLGLACWGLPAVEAAVRPFDGWLTVALAAGLVITYLGAYVFYRVHTPLPRPMHP